jgi:hypothetical protein
MEVRVVRHKFERGYIRVIPAKVGLNWFQIRIFKCDLLSKYA